MTVKLRRPWAVVWLGLLTGGVYFLWHAFIAFRELDFHARRPHSPLIFLAFLPLAGVGFMLAYLRIELENLTKDRADLGLPPAVTVRHLVALVVICALPALIVLVAVLGSTGPVEALLFPAFLGLVAVAPGAYLIARDVGEVWQRREAETARMAKPKTA